MDNLDYVDEIETKDFQTVDEAVQYALSRYWVNPVVIDRSLWNWEDLEGELSQRIRQVEISQSGQRRYVSKVSKW